MFFFPLLFSSTVLALHHCLDKQLYKKKLFLLLLDVAFLGGSRL